MAVANPTQKVTYKTPAGVPASSAVLTLASAPTVGSLLIGYIVCWQSPNSNTPAGWTLLDTLTQTDVCIRTFTKISNGTETSTTLSMNSSDFWTAAIMEWPKTVVNAVEQHNLVSNATATALTSTAIIPTTLNDVILAICGISTGVVTNPTQTLAIGAGYTLGASLVPDYNSSCFGWLANTTTDTSTAQSVAFTSNFSVNMIINNISLKLAAAVAKNGMLAFFK